MEEERIGNTRVEGTDKDERDLLILTQRMARIRIGPLARDPHAVRRESVCFQPHRTGGHAGQVRRQNEGME